MSFLSLLPFGKHKELIFRGTHYDLCLVVNYLFEIKYFKFSSTPEKFIKDNFSSYDDGDSHEIKFEFNDKEEMIMIKLKFGQLFSEK